MIIKPYGDRTILINFEQIIDENINARVVALSNAITNADKEGVTFCIPAYCSITIGFDPTQISYNDLFTYITELNSSIPENPEQLKFRKINIPVCYEEDFAIDMADVMNQTNLSWKEVVDLHTSREYRVYMLGFIAGFAYMGTLPGALECNRKAVPRLDIPAGTVGIAGLQTGIYPTKAHAGWQLVGRTPLSVFDSGSKSPFLFRAGDHVGFQSIDAEMFLTLSAEVKSNEFDINSVISYE